MRIMKKNGEIRPALRGRLAALLMALLLVLPYAGRASGPAWDYPLGPLILADKDDYLVLANKDVLLTSDYEPDDMIRLGVNRTVGEARLRKAASEALDRMFEDAKEQEGYVLYVKSAYRSYQTQRTMYYNRLEKMGYDDGLVQYPGASDHQTGLGVDILNYKWTQKDGMNALFAQEAEAQWMEQHCWEYGYVIRYESDKEDKTGIKYEPWHLRYVGQEAAAYMHERHLCLEEFTEEWQGYLRDYEARGGSFTQLVLSLNLPREIVVLETEEDGEEEISAFY